MSVHVMLYIVYFSAYNVFFVFLFAWCGVVLGCDILMMLPVHCVLSFLCYHMRVKWQACRKFSFWWLWRLFSCWLCSISPTFPHF